MTKTEKAPDLITEHIFEIVHDASGKFLDIKGSIAESVKDTGVFVDWQIDANGIKFYNAKIIPKDKEAMVNYNLIRFCIYDPQTKNYFEEQSEKFIKNLTRANLYTIPKISRLGVRTKCFMPCELRFDEINSKLFQLFYKDGIANLFGGVQKDLQIIIEVKEKDFQVKTCLGPVKADEVIKYFSFPSDKFNSHGIYIDVDCFQVKNSDIRATRALLDTAMKITWSRIGVLLDAIGI